MSIKKLLYTSFVDVGVPYGPGVNELSFIRDMRRRLGDGFMAVIPTPQREDMVAEMRAAGAEFLCSASVRTVPGWVEARTLGFTRLQRVVRMFKPDLVVMRPGSFSFPQLWIKRVGYPYVLKTAGDGNFDRFYQRGRLRRITAGHNERQFAELLAGCMCVDVVSEMQLSALESRYPEARGKAYHIDNGVDTEVFGAMDRNQARQALGFGADDVVIGYVGNFPERRGGREVVEAVSALRERFPVKGLIVGDSGEAEACRSLAARLGVSDRVNVVGEVEYARVPAFMAAMDVGFSIRRRAEQNCAELKVRQYLASGMCLVGTAGSNDFLIGQPFARIVDDESLGPISEACQELLSHGRGEIERLGVMARDYAVKNLSVEKINRQRMDLWMNLMNSRRGVSP